MNIALKGIAYLIALGTALPMAFGQTPGNVFTESGQQLRPAPVDDIVESTLTMKRRVIPYDTPREADVFWKKYVQQVIDIREKMNLPFAYPQRPFIKILLDAAINGIPNELPPMRVFQDENFKVEMDTAEISKQLFSMDTIQVQNSETYLMESKIVRNDLQLEDIQRYRIKEVWYFDKEASMMKVRILGIAPLKPLLDDAGKVQFNDDGMMIERPMFWVYLPDARDYLGRERVFNEMNDASPMSWEDVMEMRMFTSFVIKSSNVRDQRLEDKFKSRRDLLMEAQKLKDEIFNFEQDLWTY